MSEAEKSQGFSPFKLQDDDFVIVIPHVLEPWLPILPLFGQVKQVEKLAGDRSGYKVTTIITSLELRNHLDPRFSTLDGQEFPGDYTVYQQGPTFDPFFRLVVMLAEEYRQSKAVTEASLSIAPLVALLGQMGLEILESLAELQGIDLSPLPKEETDD